MPCILWNPRLFPRQSRNQAIGGHVDLLPTIFDVLWNSGAERVARDEFTDPACASAPISRCYGGSLLLGLRDGPFKFIYNATLGREELFNLTTDKSEQNNLAQSQPDLCRQYRLRISGWVAYERNHLDATGMDSKRK